MYYDLIASLPHLPYFVQANRLPITERQLLQRLGPLTPDHARQLKQAQPLVAWRIDRAMQVSDADLVKGYSQLAAEHFDSHLMDYVSFRMEMLTLLWGLRHKLADLTIPEKSVVMTLSPCARWMHSHWGQADFGLAYAHPWLPQAANMISQADAQGLERQLIDLCWNWLSRCAEQNYFRFADVMAYVFRWDMLRAWLACDATQAKVRFTELVDEVTHVERH